MKLWLLLPIARDFPPWDQRYDKASGFVVRAENETEARNLAAERAGDEGMDAWQNPSISSCREQTPEVDLEIVLRDFQQA